MNWHEQPTRRPFHDRIRIPIFRMPPGTKPIPALMLGSAFGVDLHYTPDGSMPWPCDPPAACCPRKPYKRWYAPGVRDQVDQTSGAIVLGKVVLEISDDDMTGLLDSGQVGRGTVLLISRPLGKRSSQQTRWKSAGYAGEKLIGEFDVRPILCAVWRIRERLAQEDGEPDVIQFRKEA